MWISMPQLRPLTTDQFYGGHASINVWNPKPEMAEFSLSQIWLVSDTQQGVNTMEAGWMVSLCAFSCVKRFQAFG